METDVLIIGCGIGGPACTLAVLHGARVVGSDLERSLLARTRAREADQGLALLTAEYQLASSGQAHQATQATLVVESEREGRAGRAVAGFGRRAGEQREVVLVEGLLGGLGLRVVLLSEGRAGEGGDKNDGDADCQT